MHIQNSTVFHEGKEQGLTLAHETALNQRGIISHVGENLGRTEYIIDHGFTWGDVDAVVAEVDAPADRPLGGLGARKMVIHDLPIEPGHHNAIVGKTKLDYLVFENDTIELQSIETMPDQRRKGSAKAALKALIVKATEHQMSIELFPRPTGSGGISRKALQAFYSGLGFIDKPNTERLVLKAHRKMSKSQELAVADLKQVFSAYRGDRALSSTTIEDVPLEEQVKWQHAKGIRNCCDGDLTDTEEQALYADWRKTQDLYTNKT